MVKLGIGLLGSKYYPSGATYIRLWDCGVTWADLNPAPGIYKWDTLDAIVNKGGDFLLVLHGTPEWAAKNPNVPHTATWLSKASNSPPRDLITWKMFLHALMRRYAGKIKSFQVWNEPQLAEFWYPYDSVGILAKMTTIANNIIKSYDQDAKIVSAPVLPRPSSGGTRRAARYYRELKAEGWPVDVYAAHIYPEHDKPLIRWSALVRMWKNLLLLMDAPRKPLWVTETNLSLMHGPIPMADRLPAVKNVNAQADGRGINRLYWYAAGVHDNPAVLGVPLPIGSRVYNAAIGL